jgi:hypothetical protein
LNLKIPKILLINMDCSFDTFDVKHATVKRNTNMYRSYEQRKPITSMPKDIWICGSQEKTAKRLKELEAMNDTNGVVHLTLNDADLETLIATVQAKMVDILNGACTVPVGNSNNKNCHFKLACEKGFDGEHGFSHSTATWIIWEVLRPIFTSVKRVGTVDVPVPEAEPDVWNTEAEQTSYRHCHPETLPFTVATKARTSGDNTKLIALFREILVEFFAGRRSLPRIGALKATGDMLPRPCKGPFCYRTLFSHSNKSAGAACNSFHNDEVSFLTSLARVLVECTRSNKIDGRAQSQAPRVRAPRAARAPRPPRAPRNAVAVAIPLPSFTVESVNAFATLEFD